MDYAAAEVTVRGRPFSLAGYEFLEELYARDPQPPRAVFMKAAQVGLSTYHVVKAAWLAATRAAKTLYLLPTQSLATVFGRDRLASLLAGKVKMRSPRYVPLGGGVIMFRGLVNDEGVRAQDADFVVLDELDRSPPARVTLAEDRVLASDLAWVSYLSTPTAPGVGVARLFDASDQRRWLVRCPGCRWEGDLAAHFPSCLTPVGRVCPKCGKALDVRWGRWVAAFPGRDLAGYHVSHLITSLPAAEILSQYERATRSFEIERFYNSILGLPYLAPGAAVTEEDLAAAWGDHQLAASSRGPAVAGVDVGDELYAVAALGGGVWRVVGLAVLKTFAELAAFLRDFGVRRCVVDAMPYKASAVELARTFGGVVVLAYFAGKEWRPAYERTPAGFVPTIKLDRTAAIDRAVSWLRGGRILLPARAHPAVETLVAHVKALRRVLREEAGGNFVAAWESAGADHFAFALVYMVAAADLAGADVSVPPAASERRRYPHP